MCLAGQEGFETDFGVRVKKTFFFSYPHTLTFTLTTETPINRAFQTNCEGVRAKKRKKVFFRSRRVDFSAAASVHACKSVYNPFASKEKVNKIRVKDSVCISAIRERFFDLRSVAAGSQNELCKASPSPSSYNIGR